MTVILHNLDGSNGPEITEFPRSSGVKEIVRRLRLDIAALFDEPHIARHKE